MDHFFDDEILNITQDEMNLYAIQHINKEQKGPLRESW
jgi:hypothetical protein